MEISTQSLIAILGMALVTYATRAGGLWVMGRVAASPRIEAWLSHIPGAVLISIVAPDILTGGIAGMIAVIAVILMAARTRNLLLAMVVGVLLVWALRHVI